MAFRVETLPVQERDNQLLQESSESERIEKFLFFKRTAQAGTSAYSKMAIGDSLDAVNVNPRQEGALPAATFLNSNLIAARQLDSTDVINDAFVEDQEKIQLLVVGGRKLYGPGNANVARDQPGMASC
jgi:hypothetical protein